MSNVSNLATLPKFGILALVLIAAALVAMALVTPGRASAAALSCGDVITADTTLTADVVCPAGYDGVGLDIQDIGVTLDGDGYRIIGGGGSSSKGVQVSGQSNVVVTSIHLENFRIGIYAPNAPDLTVTDSTIEVDGVIGIQTGGTTDRLTLSGNVISTRLDALLIGGGSGHVWTNNYFESTGWFSHVNGVTNATITDNIFDSPPGALAYGLHISGDGNTITRNDFTGYYIGLWLAGGANNIVSFNTIHDTGRRFGALYITGNTSGSKIYNNNFRDNGFVYINDTSSGKIGGSGSPNVFNLSKANGGGNWFDFLQGCTDSDSDGFCDSGYGPTNRVKNARDNFPLTQRVSLPPSVIEADVDIKPGDDTNAINPKSKGVVPVAILGSDSLDVNDINRSTLAFGPNEAAPAHKAGGHVEDVNGDGFPDLVSHYKDTGIAKGDIQACVTGETNDGTALEGCDFVTVGGNGKGYK